MSWLISFFENVFGDFWKNAAEWALKLLMGPVAFYMFGPLFKLSGHIATYLLDKVSVQLGTIGIGTNGLAAWLVVVFRLQECASSLMTFLVLGFMISLVKKVF